MKTKKLPHLVQTLTANVGPNKAIHRGSGRDGWKPFKKLWQTFVPYLPKGGGPYCLVFCVRNLHLQLEVLCFLYENRYHLKRKVNEAIDQQTTEDVAEGTPRKYQEIFKLSSNLAKSLFFLQCKERDKAVSQRGKLDEEIQELERLGGAEKKTSHGEQTTLQRQMEILKWIQRICSSTRLYKLTKETVGCSLQSWKSERS